MMHSNEGDRDTEAEHRFEFLFSRWEADHDQGVDSTLEELMLEESLSPLHLTKVVEQEIEP